jgi:LysR family hydrogen peroxide-inducible transcriptional activator
MTIQQFQYVLAVVDQENFEAAAEKCFVTQSTLSTMIGRLEDEIGIKIFNRKTKPVSITEEGKHIIHRLRIIVNEVDLFKNLTQELRGDLIGNFRIGVIPTIAPYLLPRFITEFADRFPQVQIVVKELTTAQIKEALKMRDIDLGILALPIGGKQLQEIPLYQEPFLLYDCTDDNHASNASLNELDYSKLCLLQEGHCLHTQVRKLCELSNLQTQSDVNIEFNSGSMDSLLRVTKTRKGITVIPYLAAIDLPEREKQHLVSFEDPVPVRQVGLLTNSFFVKKQMLTALQEIITTAVSSTIPETTSSTVMEP